MGKKFFIVGSIKDIDDEKKSDFIQACQNITYWLLGSDHQIHIAATTEPHADFYIIQSAKKYISEKKPEKIFLYLHTAANDDTEKLAVNEEKEFIKQYGSYNPHPQIKEWSVVHNGIIKSIDIIIIIGGGRNSPTIMTSGLVNKKIVLSFSYYAPCSQLFDLEVVNDLLATYYRIEYSINKESFLKLQNEKILNIDEKIFLRNILNIEQQFKRNLEKDKSKISIFKKSWYYYILIYLLIFDSVCWGIGYLVNNKSYIFLFFFLIIIFQWIILKKKFSRFFAKEPNFRKN